MQLGVGEDDPVCPSPVLTKGSNIRRCNAFVFILRKKNSKDIFTVNTTKYFYLVNMT